jgi:hypothetical protein
MRACFLSGRLIETLLQSKRSQRHTVNRLDLLAPWDYKKTFVACQLPNSCNSFLLNKILSNLRLT